MTLSFELEESEIKQQSLSVTPRRGFDTNESSYSHSPRSGGAGETIPTFQPRKAFTDFEKVGTIHRATSMRTKPTPAATSPTRSTRKEAKNGVNESTVVITSGHVPQPHHHQPSNLSEERLQAMCLRILDSTQDRAASVRHTKSIVYKRQEQFHKETIAKFRASVNAVSFSAILIRSKLERLSRQLQSQQADPYLVSPRNFEPTDACGREICIFSYQPPKVEEGGFLAKLAKAAGKDISAVSGTRERMLFVLDYDPKPQSSWQTGYGVEKPPDWTIFPLNVTEDLEEIKVHVESKENSGIQQVYVVATFNPEAQQLQPLAARALLPSAGPHFFVISDFTRTLSSLMQEDVTKQEMSETVGLLSIFSCPLPKHENLKILPEEVQVAIKKLALEALAKYLYPRLLFKQRRRWRRKLIFQTYIPPLTVETISKTGIFKTWPANILAQTIKKLKPLVVERGEYILHEDENAQSGIYFLTSGNVDILKKKSRTIKSIGNNNVEVLKSLGPIAANDPVCFGEFAFLTEDPRMASVKATSICMLWCLEKNDFHQLFSQLPSAVVNQLTAVGFEMRTKNMLKTYPLNLDVLKDYSLFSKCGNDCLAKIEPLILPHAVPKGTTITKEEDPARMFYFLRHGRCGVFRYIKKEEIHIVTLTAPAVIGDDSVIFKVPYTATVKALTNCDLYALAQEDFEQVMSGFPIYRNSIMEQANANRQMLLYQSQYRFKEMVLNLPFLRDMLTLTQRGELMKYFNPVVFHPREVICSTAHFADKVMILVEGAVRLAGGPTAPVDGGDLWTVGEAIGWTCLIPHRWARSAVAITSSKVIILEMKMYARYLRQHGIYKEVSERVQSLMFPKAANPSVLYSSIVATQHLRTLPMYPSSASSKASPHEPNFGYRVVRYGELKKNRDIEKIEDARKSQEADTTIQDTALEMMDRLEHKVERGLPRSVLGSRQEEAELLKTAPKNLNRRQKNWTRGKVLLTTPGKVRSSSALATSSERYRPEEWMKRKAAAIASFTKEEFDERRATIRGKTNELSAAVRAMKERNSS